MLSTHDGGDILIAFVGHQPAAIAVFLASWKKCFGSPKGALLLATKDPSSPSRGSWRFAETVKAQYPSTPIEILHISESLFETKAGLGSPAPTLVAKHLARSPSARAVFFVSPGFSYQAGALAATLPQGARFVESSTEGFRFFLPAGEPGESFEGVDLGLELLMRLHGHTVECSGAVREPVYSWLERTKTVLPTGCAKGMLFQMRREPNLFDLAFERAGWLHALVAIPEGAAHLPPALVDGKDAREIKKNLASHRLDRVRSVARARLGLADFRVRVSVASSDVGIREHAKRLQLPAISQRGLAAWLRGADVEDVEDVEPSRATYAGVADSVNGGGGDGPPLVVSVGTDASATLTSISTHRPAVAVVCVDQHTPAAMKSAELVRKVASLLPADQVQIALTDRLGSGLGATLNRLLSVDQRASTTVDVSPGTNAQSVALARIGFGEAWSLNLGAVRAERLRDGTSKPLLVAGLVAQGTANGGILLGEGDLANEWPRERRDFLLRAGRMLVTTLPRPIPAMGVVSVRGFRIRPRNGRARILRIGRAQGAPLDPSEAETEGPWRDEGGFLEDVVAAAFVHVGADEVRVNMRWAWSPQREREIRRRHPDDKKRPFPDEVDVTVRWRSQFICIDAKAKSRPVEPDGYDVLLRAAEKSPALFGRFCLPLVCHMNATNADLRRFGPAPKGASLIGLATLLNPKKLQEFVSAIVEARRAMR